MTIKHAFFCLLASVHLALVICGAAGLSLPKTKTGWDKVLHIVREASGSDRTHGYYSPGVGSVSRLTFILRDDKGHTWTDFFENTGSNETDLRMVEIVDAMVDPGEDDWEHKMARALAAAMLSRHPTATAVTVRVEDDDMPSMEKYRDGERVRWTMYYENTFTRNEIDKDRDQDQNEEDQDQNGNQDQNQNEE
jgi:hypothetical protein